MLSAEKTMKRAAIIETAPPRKQRKWTPRRLVSIFWRASSAVRILSLGSSLGSQRVLKPGSLGHYEESEMFRRLILPLASQEILQRLQRQIDRYLNRHGKHRRLKQTMPTTLSVSGPLVPGRSKVSPTATLSRSAAI